MVVFKNRRGREICLLNPSEKSKKFAYELKNRVRVTNDGNLKVDSNGAAYQLSDVQAAFRSGYLTARKDSARCYKSKNRKKRYLINN